MADLDPKITLLRHKLALVIGEEDCPVYNTIKALHPNALEEPWSANMGGPYKFFGTQVYPVDEKAVLEIKSSLTYEAIVFNNKTFTMHQIFSSAEAYEQTFQPHPIDCGENILLYLDDNIFRDLKQAETMDFDLMKRSEAIARRAVKSKWYYWLTAWVDKINGGLGKISRSGRMIVRKAKEVRA